MRPCRPGRGVRVDRLGHGAHLVGREEQHLLARRARQVDIRAGVRPHHPEADALVHRVAQDAVDVPHRARRHAGLAVLAWGREPVDVALDDLVRHAPDGRLAEGGEEVHVEDGAVARGRRRREPVGHDSCHAVASSLNGRSALRGSIHSPCMIAACCPVNQSCASCLVRKVFSTQAVSPGNPASRR